MSGPIYGGPVGRLDDADDRWYYDPTDPSLRYESVTAILSSSTAKPWLTPWASKSAATFAVEHLELVAHTLLDAGKEAAVRLISGAAARERDLKADRGTYVHDVLQALVMDWPIPDLPAHLVTAVIDGAHVDPDAITEGVVNFLSDHHVQPLMAEATVCNRTLGYAGTLDLVAHLPRLRLPWVGPQTGLTGLLDCKSGASLDNTTPPQLAAYSRAEEVWLPLGRIIRMPQVDFRAVLHVREGFYGGYKVVQVDRDPARWDAAWQWFTACQRVLAHQRNQAEFVGQGIYVPGPDGEQPAPPIEDIHGLGRWQGHLALAGIYTLDELATLTPAQLAAVKGVGPKAVEALTSKLTEHGLTLAAEQEVA